MSVPADYQRRLMQRPWSPASVAVVERAMIEEEHGAACLAEAPVSAAGRRGAEAGVGGCSMRRTKTVAADRERKRRTGVTCEFCDIGAKEYCRHKMARGYRCSRERGHTGRHVACAGKNYHRIAEEDQRDA